MEKNKGSVGAKILFVLFVLITIIILVLFGAKIFLWVKYLIGNDILINLNSNRELINLKNKHDYLFDHQQYCSDHRSRNSHLPNS